MALAEESVALRPLEAPSAAAGPSDSLEPPPLVLGHRRPGLWNEDDEEFFRRMFWPEYAPLQPRQHPPQEQHHSPSPALPGHKSPFSSPVGSRAHAHAHAQAWTSERIPRERRHELNLSPRPRLRTRESARARLGSRWPARVSSFTENRSSPLGGGSSSSSSSSGFGGSDCDEASDSSNCASCSGSSHAGATCCCSGNHSSDRCSSATTGSSTNIGAETTLTTINTVSHIADNCRASNCSRSTLEQEDSPAACFCHIFPSSSSAGATRDSVCCTQRCATTAVQPSPVVARARNSRPVRARGVHTSYAGASAATVVAATSISCGSGDSVCVTGVGRYGNCCGTAAATAADKMRRSSSCNASTVPALLQSPCKSILVSSTASCRSSRTGSADKKVRFLVPGADTEMYTDGMLAPPRSGSIPATASEAEPRSPS